MGLLDGLFSEDPKSQALMQMAMGLLQGAPGQRKNFGADFANAGLMGLQGYNQGRVLQSRQADAEQQRQMQAMQLKQLQGQSADQDAMRAAAQRNFAPGTPQMQPTDMETPSGPQGPGTFNPQGYARDIMGINPQAGMALQAQLAQMAAKERVKLGEGEVLNERQPDGSYKTVAQGGQKLPNGMVVGPDGKPQYLPEYLQGQKDIRAAGKTQINIDNKQESAFATAFGKQNAEEYGKLMTSDALATSKLNKLGRLESLLDASGKTGKFTPNTMDLKAAADSLGFKVDPRLPFQQAASGLAKEMALEMRNPSGGAGMPGALSDADRQYLVDMTPNLANTPEGNKILLDTAKKLAQRDKDVARLARDYRKRTGKFDEGFYQELADYSTKNPLFPQKAADDGWTVTRR
jgi:hypothetical protein